MKNALSKPMLLSCLFLAAVVVAVMLWVGGTGATGPEPRELQHGITVSSPAGQVAVWGHVLVRPGEAGIAFESEGAVSSSSGELRRPW